MDNGNAVPEVAFPVVFVVVLTPRYLFTARACAGRHRNKQTCVRRTPPTLSNGLLWDSLAGAGPMGLQEVHRW